MSFEQYHYQPHDAKAFTREALVANGVLLACFVGWVDARLPVWLWLVPMNVALVRWMLAVHELFHIQRYQDANPLLRLLLLPLTPVNVGYEGYRALHMQHHDCPGLPQDPDAFHIRGGHLLSLLGAFAFPEGSTLAYGRQKPARPAYVGMALRLGLFAGMALWGGWSFWVVWLVLRVNYAIAIWVFFHHLHYRNASYGSFALALPAGLTRFFAFVYGQPAVSATLHHDQHHRHPRVAAIHLDKLD
jgi:hypothetical protein